MHTEFREPTSADRRTEFRIMAIYVFAVVLSSGLIFLLAPVPGITAWVILVALATFLLVRWNARHSGYRCAYCGHEFQVSVLTEMVSPHGPGEAAGSTCAVLGATGSRAPGFLSSLIEPATPILRCGTR